LRSRRGGDNQPDDVEAEEEIVAEIFLFDFRFQIFVGGGQNANVGFFLLHATESKIFF